MRSSGGPGEYRQRLALTGGHDQRGCGLVHADSLQEMATYFEDAPFGGRCLLLAGSTVTRDCEKAVSQSRRQDRSTAVPEEVVV
jgi:hypothetical protein